MSEHIIIIMFSYLNNNLPEYQILGAKLLFNVLKILILAYLPLNFSTVSDNLNHSVS